jgi:hypothetical protein
MASRMHSLSNLRKNARKGQFFVLTTVAIVTILFFVGRWVDPLTQVDTSTIVLSEELYTFDNIQEKTAAVVKNSENCEELEYNLQEYRNFIRDFARDKNYKITFKYSIPSCEASAEVRVDIVIISEKVNAQKTFTVDWPP